MQCPTPESSVWIGVTEDSHVDDVSFRRRAGRAFSGASGAGAGAEGGGEGGRLLRQGAGGSGKRNGQGG